LAILGAAMACGVAAVAAQGGRWNDRLDLLTHFAPVWLAGGAACLVMAVVVRRGWLRRVTAAFSAAAVLSAGMLMWVDLARLPMASPTSTSAGHTLKLIEFNAWARNAEPARAAAWIAAEDPDVVVIPEASPFLLQEISRQTHLHIVEGAGAVIATRDTPLVGHVAWEVRDLPGASTEFTWLEMRGSAGQSFTIVGVHCLWPIPARTAWGQHRRLASFLATQQRSSLILAGDFNSTQWSFRQKVTDASFGLERRDVAIPTWPALLAKAGQMPFPFPFLSIDHVYAGQSWRTVSVKRGPRLGSDHYPLVVTLTWAPTGGS
jgi:endonuclease/exonuclease/phosphatase (EEP) superfamily protein YafD